jgi:hypothetical protein
LKCFPTIVVKEETHESSNEKENRAKIKQD